MVGFISYILSLSLGWWSFKFVMAGNYLFAIITFVGGFAFYFISLLAAVTKKDWTWNIDV